MMNKKFVDLDNRIEYCAMSDYDLELSKYQVKLLNQYIRRLKELAMEYKTTIDKAIKCFEDFVDEKYIYNIKRK